jgi:hypothetical protein
MHLYFLPAQELRLGFLACKQYAEIAGKAMSATAHFFRQSRFVPDHSPTAYAFGQIWAAMKWASRCACALSAIEGQLFHFEQISNHAAR